MNQVEKARAFAALHTPGQPVVLYNVWDAGSARAVAEAGAKAIATGSWSVAEAQGYRDGEQIPLSLVETLVGRITATVDLPVTVDFEGGYAAAPATLEANARRIVAAGAIGVNFEDRVVAGAGLYPAEEQAGRIAGLRGGAEAAGVPLFINARTDLFLQQPDHSRHASLMAEAKDRAAAYRAAGADGFFAPGLVDEALIADLCASVSSPVNVMMRAGAPGIATLARCGVARISFGPLPYVEAMAQIRAAAEAVFAA